MSKTGSVTFSLLDTGFFYLVLFCILGAVIAFCMPAVLWLIPVYILCIFFIHQKIVHYEKGMLALKVLLAALAIRLIVILLYTAICLMRNTTDLIGDANMYTTFGIYVSELLSESRNYLFPSIKVMWKAFNGFVPAGSINELTFFPYLQAIIYSMFGYSALTVKFINSLLGILVGFFIYRIVGKKFNSSTSCLAMSLVLFWPTLFIWSVTGAKDTIIIFISFVIWIIFTDLLISKLSIKRLALSLVSIFVLIALSENLRNRIGDIYCMAFVGSIAAILFIKFSPKVKKIIIISSLILFFLMNRHPAFKSRVHSQMIMAVGYQVMQSYEKGNTSYRVYPDRLYKEDSGPIAAELKSHPLSLFEWISILVKGMSYFMFAPFPQDLGRSLTLISIYPLSLLTLLFFPFMIAGTLIAIRKELRVFLPLSLFMLIYWLAAAMNSGNIGSAIRHRDVIMPIYLMFAAIGIHRFVTKGLTKKGDI